MRLGCFFILFFIVPLLRSGIVQTHAADLNSVISTYVFEKPASRPFFLLGPNTSLQNTLFSVCKQITNLTDDVTAYIPTAENTWPNFDSRKDKDGKLIIEVKPCER